ncbi:MAG TPA: cyclic nucleotide-binding domain-containing protein [Gaiellaceae bacterium]|nr:cyclic nucleotide-binding domain-containing protein [Gaiellaceae bacterium]
MPRLIPPTKASPSPQPEIPTDAREWANVLAEVPLFAHLNRRQLRKVAGECRIRRMHEGAEIVRTGEPGNVLFVVLDGEVSVRRRGVPAIPLGIGSFFGELALLADAPRTATVVAVRPVVCLTISRSRFHKLLREEPAIAIAVIGELAGRLQAAYAAA